jgi:hypothetical protein
MDDDGSLGRWSWMIEREIVERIVVQGLRSL